MSACQHNTQESRLEREQQGVGGKEPYVRKIKKKRQGKNGKKFFFFPFCQLVVAKKQVRGRWLWCSRGAIDGML